jgi:ATP-binding cassette, subfamily B, bacterial
VFQDFVRYEQTANANIGFGEISQLDDFSSVAKAAEKAKVNKLIARFPDGYSQMLGRRFEGGMDLSGGQWQRLAIARAYMRNAPVVIFDEPTAAIDARGEEELFEEICRAKKDTITVVISHRVSTVRMADRILVLRDGYICEQGTHRQLVAKDGEYSRLFRTHLNAVS